MRVVIVDTYYLPFLRSHYEERPGEAEQPYLKQLEGLLARGFGTSDAYSRNFELFGHTAVELIANCPELQSAWIREHGGPELSRLAPTDPSFLARVATAQIAEFRPDVVYVQDVRFFRREDLAALKQQGSFLVVQVGTRPPTRGQMRAFDLMLSSLPHFVNRYRRYGLDSEYVQLAFDEMLVERLRSRGIDVAPGSERPRNVSFVGTLSRRVHRARLRLLDRIADPLDVEIFGNGASAVSGRPALRRRHRGEAWGLDMYSVLASSRITLNRHGWLGFRASGYANNMRLYEATAMGALVFTEPVPNLPDLFEPGREIETYDGADDLIDKARYYLNDDPARIRIAAAGQSRTLAEHTYRKRIGQICALLESRL